MADTDTSQEDRQLEPSARKLQKAREEGQIARSRDLVHLAVLGGGLGAFVLQGPLIAQASLDMLRHGLGFSRALAMEPARLPAALGSLAGEALIILLPTMVVLAVMAIIASIVPGGIGLSMKPVAPDFTRLDPIQGLVRLFSTDNLLQIGKLLALAAGLLAVAFWFGASRFDALLGLGASSLAVALEGTRSNLVTGTGLLVLVLFFVALVDVPLQWWRHRVRLKMTHQEAREEMRESEGDPMVRGRIRSRQREVAMARMMAAVPKADVVITNPTHYAVAIRYDDARMGAPVVVAKGVDHLAARIREIAQAASVPLVEAPPLARALYAKVDIDREIPEMLYTAVAQVLAYVFRLRQWVPGRGPMPSAPTELPVPAGLDPEENKR